jgi:acyl transferase domain-containing protein
LTLEEAVSLILKKNIFEELESSNQSVGTNSIHLDISANQIRYSDKPNSDLSLDLSNGNNTIDDLNEANLQSLLSNLIKFWLMGIKVDWAKVGDYKNCYPISLPTYPFERQSYWISAGLDKEGDRSINLEITKTGDRQDEHTAIVDRFVFEKLDTTENYRLMILIKKMPFDQTMDGINRTQPN